MMSTPRLLSIKTIPRLTASLASRASPLLQDRPARFVQRPFTRLVFAMTSKAGQDLDKSTPETTWQQILSTDQYRILRQKGTEPAGTGEYNKHKEDGVYKCAGCSTALYTSETKFDSGCGWPAFYAEIPGAVERHVDTSYGMRRVEITCTKCGGHLGHVFEGEGFSNPVDERHCVNSKSLKFDTKG